MIGCFHVGCFVGLSVTLSIMCCFVGLSMTGFAELGEPPCSAVVLLAGEATGSEGIVGNANEEVEFDDAVGVNREVELDVVVGDNVSLTIHGEETIDATDGKFVMDDKDGKGVSISSSGDFVGGCMVSTDGLVVDTEVGLEAFTSGLLEDALAKSSVGDLVGFDANGGNIGKGVLSMRKEPSSLDAASSPPFVGASVGSASRINSAVTSSGFTGESTIGFIVGCSDGLSVT